MDKTNNYSLIGQCLFAFLVVVMLVTIYAALATLTVLLYVCVIVSIILSSGLLFLLMRLNQAFEENGQEVLRHRQRENHIRLQKEQQAAYNHQQQPEVFSVDDVLARIMPALDICFDNAATYTEKILQNIARELDMVQGLVFVLSNTDQMFHISGQYAYYSEEQPRSFPLGETLSGQVAKGQELLNVKELPKGYITVLSGLGKSNPRHLVIAPIVYNGESVGIMELASFKPFGENEELLIRKVCELTATRLNELRD